MQWTIDELAARSGISVRTIRFYAGKGLIPPPQLRGRTGLYGEDHLARLELVSELSALGFTLSAIEGYLERIPASAGAAELVLQRALLTPWVPERAEEVDRAELDRRAGRPLSDDDVDALAGLGIVEPLDPTEDEEQRFRLHDALGGGVAVLDLGWPSDVWQRSHELIEQHTAALAEDLMKLFQDEVLQPFRDRGRPADERSRLATAYAQIKPLTVQGLVTAFGRAVNRAIRERVG